MTDDGPQSSVDLAAHRGESNLEELDLHEQDADAAYLASSERYLALPSRRRAAIDKLVAKACGTLGRLVDRLSPAQKAKLITSYKKAVDELAAQRWLTAEQAARLKMLASTI